MVVVPPSARGLRWDCVAPYWRNRQGPWAIVSDGDEVKVWAVRWLGRWQAGLLAGRIGFYPGIGWQCWGPIVGLS